MKKRVDEGDCYEIKIKKRTRYRVIKNDDVE